MREKDLSGGCEAEKNYAVIETEALAIKWAVEMLKYYLWEGPFMAITDHVPLVWLQRIKDTNPCLTHWYLSFATISVHREAPQRTGPR